MTVCFLTKKFRIFGAFGKFFSLQSHLDWLIRSLLQMPSSFFPAMLFNSPTPTRSLILIYYVSGVK